VGLRIWLQATRFGRLVIFGGLERERERERERGRKRRVKNKKKKSLRNNFKEIRDEIDIPLKFVLKN